MENELQIRLSFFIGILTIIALWEVLFPRRKLQYSKFIRWYSNIGISFLSSFLMRLIFPLLAVEFAILATSYNWGLFYILNFSHWLLIPISVLLLDFVIYMQHRLFHKVPLLWRLHKMHHSDLDYDVTTAIRFHPIEIMLSMFIKIAMILLFGVPVLAVIIFEILLNGMALFNHGNIYIPPRIDKFLRLFVVTPDMHRVHHSLVTKETHSNFGFNFPWWDRFFHTYIDQPEKNHTSMTIGIPEFRKKKYLHIYWLLAQPFIQKK
jgi:sterol desaturase/sphingolipid hydroxylase (fatty acid hydroxylase superfamily)